MPISSSLVAFLALAAMEFGTFAQSPGRIQYQDEKTGQVSRFVAVDGNLTAGTNVTAHPVTSLSARLRAAMSGRRGSPVAMPVGLHAATGRVTDESSGKPVPDVKIMVEYKGACSYPVHSSKADSNGTFESWPCITTAQASLAEAVEKG